MSYSDYVAMFFASFVLVFLLGLQSKNVMYGRYVAAIATSFGISACNFLFVKYAASGSYFAFIATAVGAMGGIASSIWFYQNVMERGKKINKIRKVSYERFVADSRYKRRSRCVWKKKYA